MIQDKIFFDEKDPTGLSYNTPFTVYGSYQGRLWSKTPTGSIKYYTQNSDLSVYATTGSNQFSGSQTVTGSLTVTGGITGSVTTASYVEYTGVANKPTLVSGSAQVTYSGLTGVPAGIVSSSTQIGGYGIFATTGSNQFNGSQAVTGSLTVTGQVVAQTLNVQQVTSSIVYSSGSNIFGNTLGNTQQFTGSVSVTGSLAVTTTGTELQVTSTGVNLGNIVTDNHNVTGSLRVSGSMAVTGSVTVNGTGSFLTNSNGFVARFTGGATGGVLGGFFTNSTTGFASIGVQSNHEFRIFTNDIDRLTISGSTGAATFSSTIRSNDTNGLALGSIAGYRRIQYGSDNVTSFTLLTDGNAYAGLYAGAAIFAGNATNGTPFLTLNATSVNNTFNWVSTAFASNLAAGNNLIHFIGQSGSNKNSAYLGFKYAGAGSNDNILTLGLYGVDNILNINGLGNVGIGTASPSATLHVVRANDGGSGTPGVILSTGNGANDIVRFQDGTTTVAVVKNSGDLGVGVSSLVSPGGSRRLLQISNSTNGALIALGSSTTESNNPRIFSGQYDLGFAAGVTTGIINFYTNDTERMRITSDGNVLIGETNPPSFSTPSGGKLLMLPNAVIVSGLIALGSPYTQNIQIDIVYNNWGGNNVIGLVDMIITLREFGNVSGTAFGKVFATNSGSGSTFASFNTSNVTTSQCSVTATSGGDYTLRITIDPSNVTDRGSFYLTIPNAGGTGSTINSITISYV